MDINCSSPTVIVNPLLGELIARFGNFTINGKLYYNNHFFKCYFDFRKSFFDPRRHLITKDNIDNSFVVDDNGYRFPVYLLVPCGHCSNCRSARLNSFVQRCVLETQSYNFLPLFLTLTYNEQNKPKFGVSVRDIQTFFKRLRVNLERHGYFNKIRYVCVAEYGRKTSRPHYHAILWNLGQNDILSYRELVSLIEKSWGKGFIQCRIIRADDTSSFSYTAKYLFKDSRDSSSNCWLRSTFVLCSNRNGGIGRPYLRTLSDEVVRTLNIHPRFLNRFTGKSVDLMLNSYVLQTLFPSLNRSLTSLFRSSVRQFVLSYSVLFYRNSPHCSLFSDTFNKCLGMFSKVLYVGLVPSRFVPLRYKVDDSTLVRECLECEVIINKFLPRIDLSRFVYVDSQRKKFLSKLMSVPRKLLLDKRAREFEEYCAAAAQREIF